MRVLRFVIACLAVLVAPAVSKTSVVVLPPDYSGDKQALMRQLDGLAGLGPEDRILIYASRPPTLLATITRPDDPGLNRARFKARLAAQFAPVKAYLTTLPAQTAGEPPGNLMLPALLDEIGRNVISSLPEKRADVLLIGGLIYFDRRDMRWSMQERYYPADSLLRASSTEVPFGIAGAQNRLAGTTIHFCTPNGEAEFSTPEHEARVRRFWSLFVAGMSGRVGTFSYSLATCFQRFLAGESSGQMVYQPRDGKREMLRARAPIPTSLPDSMDRPGEWIFRADVPISHMPPSTSIGTAWIGLRWDAHCDIDLYARPNASSDWLYYGQVRTADGYFNKDQQSEIDGQWEFVEFKSPIDLTKAEVKINLYAGDLPAGPEGVLRIWFDRRVYEMPFKLSARSGNRGGMPMSGAHWLTIDLSKVVGLPAEAVR